MPLDQDVSDALSRFGALRRNLQRGIADETGVPPFGGKDALLCIERLARPNVTALSEATGMTRGGVSKSVARLRAAGLIEHYQTPENRKEVYYRLTGEGEAALVRLHRAMDALHARETRYIGTLPDERKRAAILFFTGYIDALSTKEEGAD